MAQRQPFPQSVAEDPVREETLAQREEVVQKEQQPGDQPKEQPPGETLPVEAPPTAAPQVEEPPVTTQIEQN